MTSTDKILRKKAYCVRQALLRSKLWPSSLAGACVTASWLLGKLEPGGALKFGAFHDSTGCLKGHCWFSYGPWGVIDVTATQFFDKAVRSTPVVMRAQVDWYPWIPDNRIQVEHALGSWTLASTGTRQRLLAATRQLLKATDYHFLE